MNKQAGRIFRIFCALVSFWLVAGHAWGDGGPKSWTYSGSGGSDKRDRIVVTVFDGEYPMRAEGSCEIWRDGVSQLIPLRGLLYPRTMHVTNNQRLEMTPDDSAPPSFPRPLVGRWQSRNDLAPYYGYFVFQIDGETFQASLDGKPPEPQTASSFTGEWDTSDKSIGRMILTQTSSEVKGTYAHANGKVNGTASGNTFKGKWTQSAAAREPYGDFELTLSAGGDSLTGKWRYGSKGSWYNFTARRTK